MKSVIIFTAVVLVCQAAVLPPEVTQHDIVLVPSAPLPLPTEVIATTLKPETKTMIPGDEVTEHEIVLVPSVPVPLPTEVIATTLTPETKTMIPGDEELPTVAERLMALDMERKSSSTEKSQEVIATTLTPEIKTMIPVDEKLPTELLPMIPMDEKLPTEILPTEKSQEVIATTLKPEIITMIPVNEELPTELLPTEKSQEVIATTLKPETKTMIPVDEELLTVTEGLMAMETQRKRRAVPFNDKDKPKPQLATDLNVIQEILSKRKSMMNDKMPSERSMKSLAGETKSQTPVNVEMVTTNPVIKSLDPGMSTIDPCELLCTKFEFDPICATNGLCLHEFPNQCILDTYNCKHKNGKFSATKDDRCQMHWLTKCEESEMI